MEQSLPEHRTYTGTIVEVFWGVGVVWLAIISYALRDWRHIQLAISLPSIITIVFIWSVLTSQCAGDRPLFSFTLVAVLKGSPQ